MTQTDFWLTHPKWSISRKMIFNEFRGVTQADFWITHPNMDEFPEIGQAHTPKIEILKKYWTSFPEIGRAHIPEI